MELCGRTLGKYRLLAEIGRGGMGIVYLAHDPTLERSVAVKVLAPNLVGEEDFVRRFLREARAAAQLSHPNIVTIYEVGQEGDLYYFAMAYLPGKPLSAVIEERGPMPVAEVLAIVEQVAAALDHAHEQGFVHRDVKPSNILVDEKGRAVLTDFGLVRAADASRLTGSGVTIGTLAYMSPEQAQGGEATAASDIYSLGVVVYEMLAGQVPFQATEPVAVLVKHVTEIPPPLLPRNAEVSPELERVVLWALAKDPRDRPATGSAFVTALREAARRVPMEVPAGRQGGKKPSVLLTEKGKPAIFQTRAVGRPADRMASDVPTPTAGTMSPAAPPSAPSPTTPALTSAARPEAPRSRLARWPWARVAAGLGAVVLTLVFFWVIRPALVGGPSPAATTATPGDVSTASTSPAAASSDTPTTVVEHPAGLIAYTTGPEGAWQIMIADPATGDAWLLPGQPPNSGVPAWSPDGRKLAFRSDMTGSWQIYTLNLDGSGLRQITSGESANIEAAWSPDGTQIAFVSERDGNKEIYVMEADGTGARRLTENPGWDNDPSWSPDGRTLAFESRREGRLDIYTIRVDGSGVTRLTGAGDSNSTPAWSPDGTRIAFERREGETYHIWVMDADGGHPWRLTTDGRENLRPAWSPDGTAIAYTSDRSGFFAIWIISLDRNTPPRRLSPGDGFDAAWSRP